MFKNYFSLFNLNIHFNIDSNLLDKRYISIQNANHPDNFILNEEKKLASQMIAELNKGYQILKSPLKRAGHILKIKNISLSSNDTNKIIMEIMSLKESKTEKNLQEKIDFCFKKLQEDFIKEDFYQAALNTLKLNYLVKITKNSELI